MYSNEERERETGANRERPNEKLCARLLKALRGEARQHSSKLEEIHNYWKEKDVHNLRQYIKNTDST